MFTDDYPPVLATQSELWRRTTLWSRWWFEFVRLNQWFEHLECFRGDSASEIRCCCFSPSPGAPHYCCCLFLCCCCCCWCCCCSCCSFPCPWSWGIQPVTIVSLSWRRQFFCSTFFGHRVLIQACHSINLLGCQKVTWRFQLKSISFM